VEVFCDPEDNASGVMVDMVTGLHPSLSAKHKFQESQNVNGSDSVTQNYPEVCQQSPRSVMGCNKAAISSLSQSVPILSPFTHLPSPMPGYSSNLI